MTDLQGQVALVTGSSRGIGAAIARRFAAEGAAVVVHGRDRQAVATVQEQIATAGGVVISALADLTDFAQIEAMRATIEDDLGPVDLVVANAGGSPIPPGSLEDITAEGWHASIDANLTATFLTVKALLPGMKDRRRGTIITMSSAAARRPTAGSPIAYAAAKAGIELLTKEIALQAGPFGIRSTASPPTPKPESSTAPRSSSAPKPNRDSSKAAPSRGPSEQPSSSQPKCRQARPTTSHVACPGPN